MENFNDVESLRNSVPNIRENAMNAIVETSLYYEDVIEKYVHDLDNPRETILFSEALRTGKQEWYNKKMERSENQEKSIQSNFKNSMKVDLNTINNSTVLSDIKIKEDLGNEKI